MYLLKLFENTPESAYWLGYIMADASLSNKRLRFGISAKDAEHLQKFVDWIGHPRPVSIDSRGAAIWSIQEPESIQLLRGLFWQEFNDSPKTFNPPDYLPYDDKELLTSYLIGFIDGDGSISYQTGRETVMLRTVSHPNWWCHLWFLTNATGFGTTRMRSDGYAEIFSGRFIEIVRLKQFARQHHLPILSRKWDRINEHLKIRGQLKFDILKLINRGADNKFILETTGCSPAYLSRLRKENSNEILDLR